MGKASNPVESERLQIQYVPIGDVRPWDKNPKKHNKKAIIESLKRFKPTQPILVQKGTRLIIAGHGRLEAFKELKYTDIPIVELDMNDEESKAYALIDNQTVISGGWDEKLLTLDLHDIKLSLPDLDMSVFGFSEKQRGVVAKEDSFDVDAATKAVKEPISKTGDIISLGNHRLMCGDSTKKEDVERLMDGKKADMVFTDPPYGVSIGDKNKMLNTFQRAGRCLENIENDTLTEPQLYDMLLLAFKNVNEVMADTASSYVCSPQGGGLGMMMMMMMMMRDAGLPIRHVVIWVKSSPTFSMGRLDYDYQHEPILYTWKKSHNFIGGGQLKSSVWNVDKPRESKLHPTMKPIELVGNAILNSSIEQQLVLDVFGGSGTTLIACEQTKRKCYMMELDPRYCDVIVKRWETLTGKKAVRPSPAK